MKLQKIIKTMEKTCNRCHQQKPQNEFSNKYRCRECSRELFRDYYRRHAEELNEKGRIWRMNNQEKVKANAKEYFKNHKQEINSYLKKRRDQKKLNNPIANAFVRPQDASKSFAK